MTPNGTFLGKIVLCQVHTDRMVNNGVYDASLIKGVDELWLTEDGVMGTSGSDVYVHAHHRLHPNKYRSVNKKEFRPNRLISIGFTGHYKLMSERFGWMRLGIAAEDVVVDLDRRVALDEIAGGVEVRTANGGVVPLGAAAVAKPCVPFTKYLLDDQHAPDNEVGPNRAFLEDGMRGFIFGLEGHTESSRLAVGDEVWAVSSDGGVASGGEGDQDLA